VTVTPSPQTTGSEQNREDRPMGDALRDVEPMVHKSQISVPYSWWAGDTASHFFVSLRDEKKILGRKCQRCGKVYVPPRKVCPVCFVENPEWVEVSPQGVLISYTIARRQLAALPRPAPVAFALIKLDGADTALLHYVGGVDHERIRIGMRVKARFAEERSGGIRDIAHFEPAE
jgi:uncharacterized OB-fold protein